MMVADAPWMAQAVQALALELRLHHAPTAEHSHRLAAHARVVAEDLRLDALDATEVQLVAVLHDVGKLAVDPHILDWPGPLDDHQREWMRRHTIEGEELLAGTAALEHLAPAVRATHEAWNGSGYPDGLAGDEIPPHRAHRHRGRRLRRDDQRACLPRAAAAARGPATAARRRRPAVRPARGQRHPACAPTPRAPRGA